MRIDPDVEIRHLCGAQWVALLGLGGALPEAPPARPWLLRVTHEGQTLKLLHSQRGRLDPAQAPADTPLRALRGRFASAEDARALRLIDAELASFQRITTRWQGGIAPDSDLFGDFAALADIGRAEPGLVIDPPPKGLRRARWLIPPLAALLLPKGRCALLLITRDGRPFTSLILRRGERGLDLVTTTEAIRDELPERVDPSVTPRLCEHIDALYGKVHVALGVTWAGWWNLRLAPSRALLRRLEEEGSLSRPRWPLMWATGLFAALRSKPSERILSEAELRAAFEGQAAAATAPR